MYTTFLSFLFFGFFFLIGYVLYLGLLGFQKLFKKKAHSTKFNNLVKTIYQKKINMAFASAFGGGVLAFFFCALEDWRWNETWGWYMFYFFT